MQKRLTKQQESFLNVYLTNGYNATRAAIAAGYSKHTARSQASRLRKHPLIAAAVEAHLKALRGRAAVTLALVNRQARRGDTDALALVLSLHRWSTWDTSTRLKNARLMKRITSH